jgi:hypothetical protein
VAATPEARSSAETPRAGHQRDGAPTAARDRLHTESLGIEDAGGRVPGRLPALRDERLPAEDTRSSRGGRVPRLHTRRGADRAYRAGWRHGGRKRFRGQAAAWPSSRDPSLEIAWPHCEQATPRLTDHNSRKSFAPSMRVRPVGF